MVRRAYAIFIDAGARDSEFDEFCAANSRWLGDHALYKVLRDKSAKPWCFWPKPLRDREEHAINAKREECRALIEQEKFAQYIFFGQWQRLKDHCNRLGVSVIGDIPFYVSYDSADVWSHSGIFKLDSQKRPAYVGGVPPDYFSETGQLWGNPVYNWQQLMKTDFEWWINRIEHNLNLFDLVRLDHFRGFVASWQVRAPATDARIGSWVKAPARKLFQAVVKRYGKDPFIAEDLGNITEDVKRIIRLFKIPGMRVLLFAFDGSPDNPHLPQNHPTNSLVFTSTHDTNTARGWFNEEATPQQKDQLFKCVGKTVSEHEVSWELIRLALASKAKLSIIPFQDVLSLGSETRMNRPAQAKGNWEWRISAEQLASPKLDRLAGMSQECNRA
jgi:4-alpha-glucanotransferase